MDTLFFTHAPLYSGCLPPENTPQAVLAVYTASASERDSQANPHSVTLHQKRGAGCCRGGRFPTPVHLGAIRQAGHHAVVLHNWASFVERRASVCACKPSLLQTQAELREPGGSVVTEKHHTESPPPSLRCRGAQGGPYKSTPGPWTPAVPMAQAFISQSVSKGLFRVDRMPSSRRAVMDGSRPAPCTSGANGLAAEASASQGVKQTDTNAYPQWGWYLVPWRGTRAGKPSIQREQRRFLRKSRVNSGRWAGAAPSPGEEQQGKGWGVKEFRLRILPSPCILIPLTLLTSTAQLVKNLPAMQETLDQEDPLERG